MNTFRPRYLGREAYKNGKDTVKDLFHAAERMLTEDYGYDFSDKNVFPRGFVDMIGHPDAFADWVAYMEDKVYNQADYELLAALRYIVDFTDIRR